MPYVQLKHETGALHIGGGRFFYAGEPQKVTTKEKDELVAAYKDLEEVKEPKKQVTEPPDDGEGDKEPAGE